MSIEKSLAIAGLVIPLAASCLQVLAKATSDVELAMAETKVVLEHVITVDPNRLPGGMTPVPTSMSSAQPQSTLVRPQSTLIQPQSTVVQSQSTPIPTTGPAPSGNYCMPYIADSISWDSKNILALGITTGQGSSCPTSGVIQIFTVGLGREPRLRRALRANKPVKSIDFSHSGQLAAVEGDDEVRIYDDDSFAHLETLSNSTKPVRTLVYSHDGTLLAVGGGEPGFARSQSEVMVYRVKDPITHLYTLDDKPYSANVLAFNKDSTQLAISGSGTQVLIYNTTSSDLMQRLDSLGTILDVDYSDNDDQLVVVGDDETVRVFGVEAGSGFNYTLDRALSVGEVLTSVAYNPGGSEIAVGVVNGTVRIYDSNNLSSPPKIIPYGSRARVLSLAFSLDGTRLAVSRDDGKVSIYRFDRNAGTENGANYWTSASLSLAALLAALGGMLLP